MYIFDQTHRKILLPPHTPKRIVSLVPSQTELLYYLGLYESIVGVTKFCEVPSDYAFAKPTLIGGTKNIDLVKLKSLHPDFILANKEENTKNQIEELQKDYLVYVSDIKNLFDAEQMIKDVSNITHTKHRAEDLLNHIKQAFSLLSVSMKVYSCCYIIWKNPWMTIGSDTFIHNMLEQSGFKNVFFDRLRYPSITLQEIKDKEPEIIFLSTEPFPFKKSHVQEMQQIFNKSRVILVDGSIFSWYGSRIIQLPQYVLSLRNDLGLY